MSNNLQMKKIASQYAEGEISEGEFIRKVLDEIAYQHSTSFWSKVMQMKEKHDYATKPISKE